MALRYFLLLLFRELKWYQNILIRSRLPINHLLAEKNHNYILCTLVNHDQTNQTDFPDDRLVEWNHLEDPKKINLPRRWDKSTCVTMRVLYSY